MLFFRKTLCKKGQEPLSLFSLYHQFLCLCNVFGVQVHSLGRRLLSPSVHDGKGLRGKVPRCSLFSCLRLLRLDSLTLAHRHTRFKSNWMLCISVTIVQDFHFHGGHQILNLLQEQIRCPTLSKTRMHISALLALPLCTLYSNYHLVVYKGVTYFMRNDVIPWDIIAVLCGGGLILP